MTPLYQYLKLQAEHTYKYTKEEIEGMYKDRLELDIINDLYKKLKESLSEFRIVKTTSSPDIKAGYIGVEIKYSTSNIIAYYDIFIEYNFYTDTYLVSLRLSSISARSDITDIEQYASKQLTWKYLK